ncbi:Hypothetical protein (Fragment), partial [Durusdinium trenchii]
EALLQIKAKKKAPGDEDPKALQVLEKTLQGETCCFGNQIFGFKQASFTLLQLLRLLPERSGDLRLIMQLLVQLAKQDIAVLTHFVGDCEAALEHLRQQPLKINAFQRLNQLCKERLAAEQADLPEKAAGGLAWDLGSNRVSRASQRLATICGCLASMSIDAASLEALQLSLLRLAVAATSWEDSTMLLTASLEALAKFRSKDVSICLQHQFCVSLVPLLQAGLRSTSSELRRRSLQLAMKVLEMEDELLWPHLPDLLSTVADGEAPAELLAALGRMGSKLRPAFQDPGGGRFLKLLEDPRRGRFLLPFLPHLACGSLPEV